MRSEYIVQNPVASMIEQRQEWFKQYQQLGNARETCSRLGISRKTFYKWLKRFNESGGNPASLADLPRTPHHCPRRTSDAVRAVVLEMRSTTGFGPRRLGRELVRLKGIRLSERTIWKIIRKGNSTPLPSMTFAAPRYHETVEHVPVGV